MYKYVNEDFYEAYRDKKGINDILISLEPTIKKLVFTFVKGKPYFIVNDIDNITNSVRIKIWKLLDSKYLSGLTEVDASRYISTTIENYIKSYINKKIKKNNKEGMLYVGNELMNTICDKNNTIPITLLIEKLKEKCADIQYAWKIIDNKGSFSESLGISKDKYYKTCAKIKKLLRDGL